MKDITDKSIWSVRQLNSELRHLLESNYRSIWIEGEVSGLAIPSSGHAYFSLKEGNSALRCAFFRNNLVRAGVRPVEGSQVLVHGQISYYEPRGSLQCIVSYMEEAGEGALRRAFELLKKKLAAEGLFDPGHKSSLPEIPRTIGIVTSGSGAALHDILATLKRRYPVARVIVYPTLVQGESAADEIVHSINLARRRSEVDLLIIARGGGSLEDLQAFNDEKVARCVFECEIPVISGVGHETDFTICDLVADYRAPTPTAAAEIASPDLEQLKQRFDYLQDRVRGNTEKFIRSHQQTLDYQSARLRGPVQKLNRYHSEFKTLYRQACFLTETRIIRKRSLFQHKEASMRAGSKVRKMWRLRESLETLRHNATNHVRLRISALTKEATHLQDNIQLMSPRHTLNRGYAIAQNDNDKVITSPEQVKPGETLRVSVSRGRFNVTANER